MTKIKLNGTWHNLLRMMVVLSLALTGEWIIGEIESSENPSGALQMTSMMIWVLLFVAVAFIFRWSFLKRTPMTILLACAFLCAETQAVAQVSIPAPVPVHGDADEHTVMQCIGAMIVIGIGIGAATIYIKAKRKGQCAMAKHRRDLEKALDGDFGDGATNNMQDQVRFEWAAEFVMGHTAPGDELDLPAVSFRYIMPQPGVTNVPIMASLSGSDSLVDGDTFRGIHGLSIDGMTNSFSVNGVPAKNAEPRITKVGDVIYVNVEGKTNVVTSWQRSTNLTDWTTKWTISAPVGNTNWTTESGAMQEFFRVKVHQ